MKPLWHIPTMSLAKRCFWGANVAELDLWRVVCYDDAIEWLKGTQCT